MKRFFSLMLAALLLVSALPFAAFAAEDIVAVAPAGELCGHTKPHDWQRNPGDDKAPTCTEAGYLAFMCKEPGCGAHGRQAVAANGHRLDWTKATVTKQPTCTETGIEEVQCSVCKAYKGRDIPSLGGHDLKETTTLDATCDGSGTTKIECTRCDYVANGAIDPKGHNFGAWSVTKEPTCVEDGVETRTCANNPEHKETRSIPATGIHTYENGECEECGAAEDANDTNSNYALTFHYKNANGNWTSSMLTVKPGQAITLPNIPSVSGYRHTGWNTLSNGTGDSITSATRWYNGMARDIYATYVESTDDGLVDLTVYAHYYVDGVYHHKVRLYVESFKESKSNTMHNWLYSDAGMAKTRAALAAEGYQWDPEKYYDYYDDGEVTTADLKSDGDKAVYVKVGSQKAIEATVLLHVHTKKEYAIARTITMPGYTAGDYVAKADALAAVKKFYTGNNMSMSDLYPDSQWEDLLDGKNSSGKYSVKVETNGTTEIHVILSNATAKSSSKADTTNPKTGDYITIAVGTMVLAAAAVVTLAEMKKRKMI